MTHLQDLITTLKEAREAERLAAIKYDKTAGLRFEYPSTSPEGVEAGKAIEAAWAEYIQAETVRQRAYNAVEDEKVRILRIDEGCTCDQETAVLGGTVCRYCREVLSKEEMPF